MRHIKETTTVRGSDSQMLLHVIPSLVFLYRKNTLILYRKSISSKLNNLSLQLKMKIIERSMSNVSSSSKCANSLQHD